MKSIFSDGLSWSQNLVPKEGNVQLLQNFFSQAEAESYFGSITEKSPWRQDPIKIFGKLILQPRLTAWVGDEGARYRYSGLNLQPAPWSAELGSIKVRLESGTGFKFNSALLNLYRDGRDSMGWHRDNEPELGPNPVIASVSLGATRLFKLRHYQDKALKLDIPLENGSVLIMQGSTQHFWEHSIPKTSRPVGPRLNITFRLVDISLSDV